MTANPNSHLLEDDAAYNALFKGGLICWLKM
jgi:hypothetical protein